MRMSIPNRTDVGAYFWNRVRHVISRAGLDCHLVTYVDFDQQCGDTGANPGS